MRLRAVKGEKDEIRLGDAMPLARVAFIGLSVVAVLEIALVIGATDASIPTEDQPFARLRLLRNALTVFSIALPIFVGTASLEVLFEHYHLTHPVVERGMLYADVVGGMLFFMGLLFLTGVAGEASGMMPFILSAGICTVIGGTALTAAQKRKRKAQLAAAEAIQNDQNP